MDMRYDNVRGVKEFIMKIVHFQNILKAHDIDLSKKFLVPHVLNCLHIVFAQIVYNTFSEKWTINDLITKCVIKEEKLKKEKNDLALLNFSL